MYKRYFESDGLTVSILSTSDGRYANLYRYVI